MHCKQFGFGGIDKTQNYLCPSSAGFFLLNNGSIRQLDRGFVSHGARPFLPEERKVPHIIDCPDTGDCCKTFEKILFERYIHVGRNYH